LSTSILYLNVNIKISFWFKPSKSSNIERKPSQQQWGRGNFTEGKVPHIRMDNGAALQVYRGQTEATRNFSDFF